MLSTLDYHHNKDDDSKNWLIHTPEELEDTIYDLPTRAPYWSLKDGV